MKLKIKNKSIDIIECKTFFSKLKGLMFSKQIPLNKALLFSFNTESTYDRSIHMLFVFYPIMVYWINSNFKVVDKVLAKPFGPYYQPKKPSRYILECHKDIKFEVGDVLHINKK